MFQKIRLNLTWNLIPLIYAFLAVKKNFRLSTYHVVIQDYVAHAPLKLFHKRMFAIFVEMKLPEFYSMEKIKKKIKLSLKKHTI